MREWFLLLVGNIWCQAGGRQDFPFLLQRLLYQFPHIRNRLIPKNGKAGAACEGFVTEADRAEIVVHALNGKGAPIVCYRKPYGKIIGNFQFFYNGVGSSRRAGKNGAVAVL